METGDVVKNRDCRTFPFRYNGPNAIENDYDGKLKAAFEMFSSLAARAVARPGTNQNFVFKGGLELSSKKRSPSATRLPLDEQNPTALRLVSFGSNSDGSGNFRTSAFSKRIHPSISCGMSATGHKRKTFSPKTGPAVAKSSIIGHIFACEKGARPAFEVHGRKPGSVARDHFGLKRHLGAHLDGRTGDLAAAHGEVDITGKSHSRQ